MALDTDKIDEAVLALLFLTLHDHWRAWKGFDWDALNRLYEKDLIDDPVNSQVRRVHRGGVEARRRALPGHVHQAGLIPFRGQRPSVIRPRRRRRAAATQALDPVFLVGRDLPRQGQPAIKGEIRDRHEKHLPTILMSEIEFAEDPAFVAGVVDPGDLASGRQSDVR